MFYQVLFSLLEGLVGNWIAVAFGGFLPAVVLGNAIWSAIKEKLTKWWAKKQLGGWTVQVLELNGEKAFENPIPLSGGTVDSFFDIEFKLWPTLRTLVTKNRHLVFVRKNKDAVAFKQTMGSIAQNLGRVFLQFKNPFDHLVLPGGEGLFIVDDVRRVITIDLRQNGGSDHR